LTKVNRKGEAIEYVKIYDHSDSEEWSFSEDEAEQVSKRAYLNSEGSSNWQLGIPRGSWGTCVQAHGWVGTWSGSQ
jgi:hypothetical protein